MAQDVRGVKGRLETNEKCLKMVIFGWFSDDISMDKLFHGLGPTYSESACEIASKSSRNPYVQMRMRASKTFVE